MRIAYIRSSTIFQNHQYQIEALNKYKIEKIFIDKTSGKNTDRPQFKDMMEFVRSGDELFIYDFSRISRSLKDLLEIVELLNNKGVKLVSIKENLDTSTSTGKLMLSMIGAVNEFQRMNLLEKQREGIAIAREKGRYKGRKKIEHPENWQEIIEKWRSREVKSSEAMRLTGLKKSTFYRLLKEETL